MYWEFLRKYGNSLSKPNGWANSTHGKLHIFGKMRLSSFQKYIVFYAYYNSIHMGAIRSSPIFPVLSTLFPNTESYHLNTQKTFAPVGPYFISIIAQISCWKLTVKPYNRRPCKTLQQKAFSFRHFSPKNIIRFICWQPGICCFRVL